MRREGGREGGCWGGVRESEGVEVVIGAQSMAGEEGGREGGC